MTRDHIDKICRALCLTAMAVNLSACTAGAPEMAEVTAPVATPATTVCKSGYQQLLNEWRLAKPGEGVPSAPSNEKQRVCDGLWKYRKTLSCRRPEFGCDTWHYEQSWVHGLSPGNYVVPRSATLPIPKMLICSGAHCDWYPDPSQIPHTCNNWRFNDYRPDLSGGQEAYWRQQIANDQIADGMPNAPQYLSHIIAKPAQWSNEDQYSTDFVCNYDILLPVAASAATTCAVYKEKYDESCGVPSQVLWSQSMGRTLAQLEAEAGGADRIYDAQPYVYAPMCSTFPELHGPDQAEARFSYLEGVPNNLSTVHNRLIGATKLLVYETYGDKLTPTQRATARALYQSDWQFDLPELCGSDIPDGGWLGNDLGSQKRAKLVRCARLRDEHVKRSPLVALELAECVSHPDSTLDLLKTYPTIAGDIAVHGSMLDFLDRLLLDLFKKQIDLKGVPGQETLAIAKQLHQLELWTLANWNISWARANRSYGDPGLPAQQLEHRADVGEALATWWAALWNAYDATGPALATLKPLQPSDFPDQSAFLAALAQQKVDLRTALGASRSKTTLASQNLVKALFTKVPTAEGSRLPLHAPRLGDVFAELLTEGLGGLTSRLDELNAYHDFACLFTLCAGTASRVAYAYKLIGKLDPAQDLTAAMTAMSAAFPVGETLGGWKPAFQTIAAERSSSNLLSTIWSEYHNNDDDLDVLSANQQRLVKVVLEAQVRDERFTKTGELSPAPSMLNTGATQEKVQTLRQQMNERTKQLRDDRVKLEADIVNFTRAQIDYIDAGSGQYSAEQRALQLAAQHAALESDLEGLAENARIADVSFGTIVEAFRKLGPGLGVNQILSSGLSRQVRVSARDALYTGGPSPQVSSIDIDALRTDVDKGKILQVNVQGLYQPTCALRQLRLLSRNGPEYTLLGIDNARTGPEGFGVTSTGTEFRVQQTQDAQSEHISVGVKMTMCAGAKAGVPTAGLSMDACFYADAGVTYSHTDSRTEGRDRKTSASFSGGLRVDNAPFPNLPVGALVMVVRDQVTLEILDIQIARTGSTTIVPPASATVFFVVNDRQCDNANVTDRLTVDVHTLSTLGTIAPLVVDSMAEVLKLDAFKLEPYLAQGRLLPADISTLWSTANIELNNRISQPPLNLTIDNLPGSLTGLFNNFVGREIQRIARGVEILDVQRRMDSLVHDVEAVRNAAQQGATANSLREAQLALMLSQIDEAGLRDAAVKLVRRARDYLYPPLRIWYPLELDKLATGRTYDSFRKAARELSVELSIDPGLSVTGFVGPGKQIETMMNTLIQVIEDADAADQEAPDSYSIARISFPKVGVGRPYPANPPYDSNSRMVDPGRAEAFWNAFYSPDPAVRRRAPVVITPEDLYASGGSGAGTIPCDEVSPVVRRIGFHFANADGITNEGELNSDIRFLGGFTPRLQRFITPAGWQEFMLAPATPYATFRGRVTYGATFNAEQAITAPFNPGRPTGMSPFGVFELDFASAFEVDVNGNPITGNQDGWPLMLPCPLGTPVGLCRGEEHHEAEELVVVLEYESRKVGLKPGGVAKCHNYPLPSTGQSAR